MIKYLFIATFIIIPFTTIFDSVLRTATRYEVVNITPLYFSLLDDLLIFILFLSLCIKLLNNTNFAQMLKLTTTEFYYFIVLFLLFVSLVVSSFFFPTLIILSGLRSVLFIFLIGLLMLLAQRDFIYIQKKLIPILIVFIYLNLVLQMFQIFSFNTYFGQTSFGISPRTIGFLKEPNALSLLDIFSLYFIYFYMENSFHKKLLVFALLPISLLLSGSITPMIGLFFVLLLYVFRFNFKLMLIVFPIASVLVFLMIPEITSRPGLIHSLTDRFDIITNSLTLENIFFSTQFGYGTNTATMLTDSTIIPESTIASLLINIGLFGTLFFYIFFFKLGLKSKKALVFILLMGTASCTNVIFESTPVNLLFAFEVAYLLKNQKYFGRYDVA